MSLKLKFTTLDVFTHTRFSGNQLAIVHIPPNSTLTHAQKLTISNEFNLSETVFLHTPSSPTDEIKINIFTTTSELPFAGHPTIGTGFYILSGKSGLYATDQTPAIIKLNTLSGIIPVSFDTAERKARLCVQHDIKIHAPLGFSALKACQDLLDADYVRGAQGDEPICSIVKGMNFILWELASSDALSRLHVFPRRATVPEGYLGEYGGFVGVYSFVRVSAETCGEVMTVRLETRMFDGWIEDPATGSAASALGAYLALTTEGPRVRVFEITQGVDMGRRSEIRVKVTLGGDGQVEKVELEGGAVEVMEGVLTV